MSRGCLAPSLGFITDPLLTALSPDLNPSGTLAPHSWRLGLCAQRHAANSPIDTHTLVFTAGFEALPITIYHSIMLAACSHHICTHSLFVPRLVSAVVTVQSLVIVAGVGLIAHLAHLPGTGLTAVTAVHQQTDARRAVRGLMGTLTGPFTVLRAVVGLYNCCGGRHGCGVLAKHLLNRGSCQDPPQRPTHHG